MTSNKLRRSLDRDVSFSGQQLSPEVVYLYICLSIFVSTEMETPPQTPKLLGSKWSGDDLTGTGRRILAAPAYATSFRLTGPEELL